MRLRWILASLTLGCTLTPSYAERPKTTTAPDTPEVPALPPAPPLPLPFLVVPPAGEASPIVRVKATDFAAVPPPVLQITNFAVGKPSRMATQASTQSYAVADLVIPLPALKCEGTVGGLLTEATPVKTCEQELIRQLTTQVAPHTWQEKGGQGTIAYIPQGCALVVSASKDVHEQVQAYLDTLRKRLDTQIVLETRIVSVSDAFFTTANMAKLFDLKDKPTTKSKPVFLQPTQLERLLNRLQEDKHTNVLTAPKITTFDGQECRISTGESHFFLTGLDIRTVGDQLLFIPKQEPIDTGIQFDMRPQLSADQKQVQLNLKLISRRLAQTPVPTIPLTMPIRPVAAQGTPQEVVPFTQHIEQPKLLQHEVNEEASIPVGQTLLLYAGKATYTAKKQQPLPMFDKLPILAALFNNNATEERTEHLLVLVTPRVITVDGEEASEAPAKPDRLTQLLHEYHAACRAGKTDEARRLALECLTLDPKCFAK